MVIGGSFMRVFLAIALFLACRCGQAVALTDTWWNPAESGWGLSVVHDRDTVTIGLFIHDTQGEPRWYSAALTRIAGTPQEQPEFTGPLFQTRRVPNGEAGTNLATQVGEMAFRAHADGKALLEYTLDGAAISKMIQRFAFTEDALEGLHFATLLPAYDGCRPDFQALPVFVAGVLSAERCEGAGCGIADPHRDRSPVHIRFHDAAGEVCRIDGRFTRYGRSGGIAGTYRCRDGGEGHIEMPDIEFTSTGFHARFTAEHPACDEFSGLLSGVRSDAR